MRRAVVQAPVPVVPPPPMIQIDTMPIERLGYTPEEAAISLGLGLSGTYDLIKEGRLQVVRHKRRIIVPVDEIRAFLVRELTRCSNPVPCT